MEATVDFPWQMNRKLECIYVYFYMLCLWQCCYKVLDNHLLLFRGWVVSISLRPHGLSPFRLLCPSNFPVKNTGVGCHFLRRTKLIHRVRSINVLEKPLISPLIHSSWKNSVTVLSFSDNSKAQADNWYCYTLLRMINFSLHLNAMIFKFLSKYSWFTILC